MKPIKIIIITSLLLLCFACGQYDSQTGVTRVNGIAINEFDMRLWPSSSECKEPDAPDNPDICYQTYFQNLRPGAKLFGDQTLPGLDRSEFTSDTAPIQTLTPVVSNRLDPALGPDVDDPAIERNSESTVADVTMEKQEEGLWELKNNKGMEKSVNIDEGFENNSIDVDTFYGNDSSQCVGAVYKRIHWNESKSEFSIFFKGSSCLEFCRKYPGACN